MDWPFPSASTAQRRSFPHVRPGGSHRRQWLSCRPVAGDGTLRSNGIHGGCSGVEHRKGRRLATSRSPADGPPTNGSASRTRTCDPVVNSHLLYQLSYRGSGFDRCLCEVPARVNDDRNRDSCAVAIFGASACGAAPADQAPAPPGTTPEPASGAWIDASRQILCAVEGRR